MIPVPETQLEMWRDELRNIATRKISTSYRLTLIVEEMTALLHRAADVAPDTPEKVNHI